MLSKKKSVPFAVRFYGAFFAIRQRLRFAFAKAPILLDRGSVLHRGKSFVLRPAESSPFVRPKTSSGRQKLRSSSGGKLHPAGRNFVLRPAENRPFTPRHLFTPLPFFRPYIPGSRFVAKQPVSPQKNRAFHQKEVRFSAKNSPFPSKTVHFGSNRSVSVHFRPFRFIFAHFGPFRSKRVRRVLTKAFG